MKTVKQFLSAALVVALMMSLIVLTPFVTKAETNSETIAFTLVTADGTQIDITESQFRAARSITVTSDKPWETISTAPAKYFGTFYKLSDILTAAGIDPSSAHGILAINKDSDNCAYEKSDVNYLYVYDQSEVESYGYPVGDTGTNGTAMQNAFPEEWLHNIASFEIAFDHDMTYPGGECAHKCLFCGKEEHYRQTIPSIFGWKMYDCQYKLNSWVNAEGHWVFVDPDGYVHKGWLQQGNTWYYMDDEGIMVTGVKEIDGVPYCFSDSGAMGVGWVKAYDSSAYTTRWYYASSSGRLQTGWKYLGGKWYYLDPYNYYMYDHCWLHGNPEYYFLSGGAMATGWVLVIPWEGDAGEWYYFSSSGAMVTGWQYIGGKWYFFQPGGRMARNEWAGGYWLSASGAWTYPYKGSWHYDGYGWWFGDTSGWYARNQYVKINDYSYYFDGNGYWRY